MIDSTPEIYVCLACGKRSHDRHGQNPIDKGWDESCVLNSALLPINRLVLNQEGNRVARVIPEGADDVE